MGRTRNPNGASSIYQGSDGYWHGRVTVGVRDDGKPDRRHVMRKSKAEAIKAVRDLEKQRDAGNVRKPGKCWTVSTWLQHWLENIAKPSLRENSYDAYRVAVDKHLMPGVGAHRLDKLEPEHLEKLYAKMQRAGSKPGRAHQVHRTIRTALGEAARRGIITRNVAALAKPPRLALEEVEPYTIEEIRQILNAASTQRNGARWAVALALGLRQGEALGLRWDDVDFNASKLRIRRARLRPRYQHGCPGGACGRTPGYCPQRRAARPATADTKSDAGRRTIGLPAELANLLRRHRDEQAAERESARQLWRDEGWVFASATGAAINPNTDYHAWKKLIKDAGVRDARLHDARHTAATALLLLGVPQPTVMGVMGWSTASMANRYQHITDQIRGSVAKQVDGLIWAKPKKKSKGKKQDKKRAKKRKRGNQNRRDDDGGEGPSPSPIPA